MKIQKQHAYFALYGCLAVLLADQPRRSVPTYWATGLDAAQANRFVIQEEGDVTLKFVSAQLRAGGLELVPVPFYHGRGSGTRSVRDIARRFSLETKESVMAAVNGGFFDTDTGLPIGFLLRDSQMDFFNMPQGFVRSMVGFSDGGSDGRGERVWINSPREMPKAYLDTQYAMPEQPLRTHTLGLHQINVPGGKNALCIFTSTYGMDLHVPEDAVYYTALPEPGRKNLYRIDERRTEGNVKIPADGLVVALHGNSRAYARLFPTGTLVRPRWSLPEEWTRHGVTHGLLAGPRLLQSGKIQVTAKLERLDALKSRDRVALAVKPDGDALLVWAHKNSFGNLSFEELAGLLEKMGARDAIALDGGKSRAIFAQSGEAFADERYFEGGRPVANALLLAVKPTTLPKT